MFGRKARKIAELRADLVVAVATINEWMVSYDRLWNGYERTKIELDRFKSRSHHKKRP